MANYIFGDIQGCFEPLQRLLDKIHFDATSDQLWFAGDLVNRGRQSLETLRLIRSLGDNVRCVLGNHDITLIASHYGIIPPHASLTPLLAADDAAELVDWLRHQPLLHVDPDLEAIMVHAGIPLEWDLQTAKYWAKELEKQLQQPEPQAWLQNIYGNRPDTWNPQATELEKQRYSLNAFTRMRYCYPDGRLDFQQKLGPATVKLDHPSLSPWFLMERAPLPYTVYFGHWSTLGYQHSKRFVSLDTGCVWGGCLSALRISTPPELFQVTCNDYVRS